MKQTQHRTVPCYPDFVNFAAKRNEIRCNVWTTVSSDLVHMMQFLFMFPAELYSTSNIDNDFCSTNHTNSRFFRMFAISTNEQMSTNIHFVVQFTVQLTAVDAS